jgi:hypothetical protein
MVQNKYDLGCARLSPLLQALLCFTLRPYRIRIGQRLANYIVHGEVEKLKESIIRGVPHVQYISKK